MKTKEGEEIGTGRPEPLKTKESGGDRNRKNRAVEDEGERRRSDKEDQSR